MSQQAKENAFVNWCNRTQHRKRWGQGSVKCTKLTWFGRLYFQLSGLLQGWYLHPKSASYLSTWMVPQTSPIASEHATSILNYGSNCSFLDPDSPFLVALKCPTFSNRQLVPNMKNRKTHLFKHQCDLLPHIPKTVAIRQIQHKGIITFPLWKLHLKKKSLYHRRVPFYRAIPSDIL